MGCAGSKSDDVREEDKAGQFEKIRSAEKREGFPEWREPSSQTSGQFEKISKAFVKFGEVSGGQHEATASAGLKRSEVKRSGGDDEHLAEFLATPSECKLRPAERITVAELDRAISWLKERQGTRLVKIYHDYGQHNVDYYSSYDIYSRLRPMQRALHGKSETLIVFTCSGGGNSACLVGFSTIPWDFIQGGSNAHHYAGMTDSLAWVGVTSSSQPGPPEKLDQQAGKNICTEMINVGPWYGWDLGFWDTVWGGGASYSHMGGHGFLSAYPKPSGHSFLSSRWNFVPGEIVVLQVQQQAIEQSELSVLPEVDGHVESTGKYPKAPMTLSEQVAVLKRELRLEGNIPDTLHQAAELLGVSAADKAMLELADRCMEALEKGGRGQRLG